MKEVVSTKDPKDVLKSNGRNVFVSIPVQVTVTEECYSEAQTRDYLLSVTEIGRVV